MPNHITTVAVVTGPVEKVDAFRVLHIRPRDDGKGDIFDFRTIIPVPACVEGTESGTKADEGFFALTGMTQTKFARFDGSATRFFEARRREGFEVSALTGPEHLREWLAKHHPDVLAAGEKTLACFRETGCMSWYEWNIEHWGTKWEAYDYEMRSHMPGEFIFKFETAWDPPRPILAKLAEMWPELRIETKSVDEGGGAWTSVGGVVQDAEETREMHLAVYGHTERIDPDSDEATS